MPTIPANNNTGLYNTTGNAVPTNGNISTNNITASGNVTVGGYIYATGSITTDANFVGDLVGNVTGNIVLSGGNTEVIYNASGVTGSSPNFTFNSATNVLDVNGNVQANYFIGDGSQLTGLPAGYSNANVVSLLSAFGSNVVNTTGNVTAGYFLGDGSLLTGIPASYGNANVSAFLPTYTGNLGANTITATGNITGLNLKTSGAGGNITGAEYVSASYFVGDGSLLTNVASSFGNANVGAYLTTYSGNISAGNISVAEDVVVAGDVTAGVFYGTFAGNISGNITVPGSNTWVLYNDNGNAGADSDFTFNSATNTMTVTGTANLTNINATTVSASGNITGGNIAGSGAGLTSIPGANVTGTVANAAYATAAGTATTATSAGTANTVTDAAQANITSLGTLTSLSVTGNITGGNINTSGNVAGAYILGNGSQLTGLPEQYGNANVASYLPTYTGDLNPNNITTSGNLIIGQNLTVNGNTTYVNVDTITTEDPIPGLGRGANNTPLTTNDGKDRGAQLWYYDSAEKSAFLGYDNSAANMIMATDVTITDELVTVVNWGTTQVGNLAAQSTVSGVTGTFTNVGGTLSTAAQPNITSVGTLSTLAVTGNISGGNIAGAGAGLSNLTGANVTGTVANAAYATTAGSASSATSAITANTVTDAAQANITSVGTLTSLTSSGNITGANLVATDSVFAGSLKSVWVGTARLENDNASPASLKIHAPTVVDAGLTATGNIVGGNLYTAGNITGSYIFGNGSQLTGIISSAAGSNTQIQYNNAGAFAGADVFSFDNTSGNVAVGNIVIQANTTTNGAAQNIYTNSNQYLGNAAASPVAGRLLFGSGLSNVAGGSGDFSNSVDIVANFRSSRMVLADRYQKTDNGLRSRALTLSNFVDISGNLGVANNNSRITSQMSEMYIGGGNSLGTNPAVINGQSVTISLGNNGNATVGNTAIASSSLYQGYVDLRAGSSLTNMLCYYPNFNNGTGNSTAWTNAYGISPTISGNATIANFSLVHLQNSSGNGWGVSSSVPPTNYYFLNNQDIRSESIIGPIRQYQDKTYLEATGSGTIAVDWDNGTTQVFNLTGNTTFTFQDPTVGTTDQRLVHTITMIVYQDGTGRTVTLPTPSTTYRYADGNATVSSAANSVSMITSSAIRVGGSTQYLITVSPGFTS